MPRFEQGGDLAGQEMYGVGESGESCVILCDARCKICP